MLRVLPFALELVLLVFCLIDCIQTDSSQVRNLPKVAWVLLILIFPLAGGIAWLVAGRPTRDQARAVPWPSTRTAGFPENERPRRPTAPDDDPEFLRGLRTSSSEHERLLAKWEEDRRRREEQQRQSKSDGDPGSSPT